MMEVITNFHFIRPLALLLFPISIGLWWLWRRGLDPLRGWREQMEPVLLEALVVNRSRKGGDAAYRLLAAWLLAILAIAGPTWRLEPSPFADDSTPMMVLVEVDESMMTADLAPSRLERAQLKVIDLASARRGQPLGLIAYAGSAHLVLPPTRDTAIVGRMARELSPDIMPLPGNRLEAALRTAERALAESGGGNVVILADSVGDDPKRLTTLADELSLRVQFLAVTGRGSSGLASIKAAARALDAEVEEIDPGDRDVSAILRRAMRTPISRAGEAAGKWQEAGYGVLPLIALILLASFRRSRDEVTDA